MTDPPTAHQARAAGRAARLLRRRRPGRRHRREGARALRRRRSTSASEIVHNKHVVQHPGEARRDLRRRDRRGARGRDRGLLRARRRPGGARGGRARWRCKTIDATCPLVTKVHHEAVRFAERRLRHPAHRPRGPRGGRRHRRRGARAHHARRRPGRRRQRRPSATPRRSSGSRRPRCRSTRRWRPCARLRERFPSLQDPPSDDICYATQNRQLAVKQMAADCDLMIVVGSRNSSNSVRLVEVALEHGSRAGAPRRLRRRDRRGLARRGRHRRRHLRRVACPRSWSRDVLAYLAERGYGDVAAGRRGRGEPAVLPAQRDPARPQGPRHVRQDAPRRGVRGSRALH